MNPLHRALRRPRGMPRYQTAALLLLAMSSNPADADAPGAGSARATEGGGAPLPVLVESAMVQAQRLTGLGRHQLKLLDAAAVNWPDGSGGCPEPGRLYTQALVPGFRIRIQAQGRLLNYHATRGSTAPVLCPADRVQPALPGDSGKS